VEIVLAQLQAHGVRRSARASGAPAQRKRASGGCARSTVRRADQPSGVRGFGHGRDHHLHPGLDQLLVVDRSLDAEDVAQQAG
jgi:hypothetical protein